MTDFNRMALSLKSGDIGRTLFNNIFNTDSPNHIDPSTKVVLDEAILKENNSELLLFKDIKEHLGKETTFGRIILNLAVYNIKDSAVENIVDDDEKKKAAKAMGLSAPLKSATADSGRINNEIEIKHLISYKNFTFTKSSADKLYEEMANLFIDKKISHFVMEQFTNNLNWLGFTLVPYLAPSMDLLSVSPTKEIKDIRKKTFDEYSDAIASNDVLTYNNEVEPKILSQAAKILDEKHSSGKLIFDSGVNGSFNTNYKITSVARGVVAKSNDPAAYTIATSSLVEGVSKKEMPVAADIAVQGSQGRAIDTRQGGYKVKQFYAGFQSISADFPGTDCKTPYTLEVLIDNYKDYLYRNIEENGKIVNLSRESKDKYLGKVVKLRSPFFCQNPKICHVCAGDMIHKLGIRNIGLSSSNIGSALLNASLKAFHSLSVKSASFNIEDFMTEI